jgi:5'(3')-deoxyribonucleotidase
MVFSKKKNLNYSFILQDKQLEVVEKFSYLGIIFTISTNHNTTERYLAIVAYPPLFQTLKQCHQHII